MATWVIGDIHGCFDEFQELLKNKNIKQDDTIILIGDIIDRGPKSYEMLKWAMENVTDTGKYQMIMGNHEDIFISEVKYHEKLLHSGYSVDDIAYMKCKFHFNVDLIEHGYKELKDISYIVSWMENLPLYKDLNVNGQRYIIAHAWASPNLKHTSRMTFLWFREVSEDFYGVITYTDENSILIHGHTPTIFFPRYDLPDETSGKVFINGNGINIDCGCAYRTRTSNLAAIRLEDKKIIYLYEEE